MKKAHGLLVVSAALFAAVFAAHPEAALGATYEFNVDGYAMHQFQSTITYHPLKKVSIEVWDENIGADEQLALTYTNDSGYYSAGIHSDESDGPDIYVKATLKDYFDSVEAEDGGAATYLVSSVHDNQTTGISVNLWFTADNGLNDEANLYRVVYDALKDTNFGTKSMDMVHVTRSGVSDDGSFFETTELAEIHIGTNEVWYYSNDYRYGTFTVCHELGHAIMWAMRGHSWPDLGTAPDPHYINQEAGRGFAWVEGWASLYGAAKAGVAQSSYNFNFDDPDSCWRTGTAYWAGDTNSDGTSENPTTGWDNSGLGVEGAVASAGCLIGFDTVWPIVRDNGDTISTFANVWSHLPKTQAQRISVERNNMIFSRGYLAKISGDGLNWFDFSDGLGMPPDCTLSFRALENTAAALNLASGELDATSGMRFSYRTVTDLAVHREWFPYDQGWTEIGTATSKLGGYWQVTGSLPLASGDYWIRVQALYGTGAQATADTIQPAALSGSFFTEMRNWSRNTLRAVRYLNIAAPQAGDPSFVQPDRRQPEAVAEARAERQLKLAAVEHDRKLAQMLKLLETRAATKTVRPTVSE